MAKYDALTQFLRGQADERSELTLSFASLETILGHPLPPTARVDRPWWANTQASNHARRWLNAGWRVARVDLAASQVVFDRGQPRYRGRAASTASTSGRSHSAYDGLREFLAKVPEQQHQLALTLTELGEAIGRPLPPTALSDVCWWANTRSASPQAAAWLELGWFVDRIYLARESPIVVFRRKGHDPLRSIPRYVKSLLESGGTSIRPDAGTLRGWVHLCRAVGWYFEGSVLYERGGVSLDALSEIERVELDEDYAVCKRELNRHRRGGQA